MYLDPEQDTVHTEDEVQDLLKDGLLKSGDPLYKVEVVSAHRIGTPVINEVTDGQKK